MGREITHPVSRCIVWVTRQIVDPRTGRFMDSLLYGCPAAAKFRNKAKSIAHSFD